MIKVKQVMIGSLLGILVGHIFFMNILLTIFFGIVGGVLSFFKQVNDEEQIMFDFKEFLSCVYGEILVGHSFRNGVSTSIELYDFKHKKLEKALMTLNTRVQSGISEKDAWLSLSEMMKDDYISKFSQTLCATYDYSGNVSYIIKTTIMEISDAIDIALEVKVLIASKRLEFYIMMSLPLILLGVLNTSQYNYMSILYESVLGRLVMGGVLMMMMFAYLIGKKLIDIL